MLGSGDDRISALPDDLLVKILLHRPTIDAVCTAVLSKRWRYVWTMLPKLMYKDSDYEQGPGKKESIWWFLEQSMELHKAPVLQTLLVDLGPNCPVDVNLGELITIAVHRKVCDLNFKLNWLSKPISLPDSFYICDTLVCLSMVDRILVDAPYCVCLPSLKTLLLIYVVYEDEDSLVRLLSGCPNLMNLAVVRQKEDNLETVIVKVPSLKMFFYRHVEQGDHGNVGGNMVIDSPALSKLFIQDYSGNPCLIEKRPRLDKALINIKRYPPDNKFMTSLSSVMNLTLVVNAKTVACYNAINFSQLIECTICPFRFDWLEPFMCFLQNSPTLKVLHIDQTNVEHKNLPISFSRPSYVPGCLSNHLEIFEWKEYGGRNAEKEVMRYIFANSMCLKRVGISIRKNEDVENRKKMMKELESMSKVSTSSQLLFSTQFKPAVHFKDELSD